MLWLKVFSLSPLPSRVAGSVSLTAGSAHIVLQELQRVPPPLRPLRQFAPCRGLLLFRFHAPNANTALENAKQRLSVGPAADTREKSRNWVRGRGTAAAGLEEPKFGHIPAGLLYHSGRHCPIGVSNQILCSKSTRLLVKSAH